MSSSSPSQILSPDIIHGVSNKTCTLQSSKLNFSPGISSEFPKLKQPSPSGFKISPSILSSQRQHNIPSTSNIGSTSQQSSTQNFNNISTAPRRRFNIKRKPDFDDSMMNSGCASDKLSQPQRKVHLSDELVAQTMSELYISNPRPKIARRNLNNDVKEAINLSSLEDLETKFSNHNLEEYSLPPQRTRKLPNRSKMPQLRVSLHQDLRNMRTSNSVLPESILSKYRSSPRSGSTAVVLWRPPGGVMPDIISSALRSGPGSSGGYTTGPVTARSRIRCYSEVTSTPYSSHENLSSVTTDHGPEAPGHTSPGHGAHSPSAEAPELSASFIGEIDGDIPLGVNIHRRNSAPEINESLPFNDDSSMEL